MDSIDFASMPGAVLPEEQTSAVELPTGELAEKQAPSDDKPFFREKELVANELAIIISGEWSPEQLDVKLIHLDFVVRAGLVGRYQEQPYLLDPHLEDLIRPAMDKLSELMQTLDEAMEKGPDVPLPAKPAEQARGLLRFLYILCTVRGYKTIVKFFSHHVSDLEPAFRFLNAQDRSKASQWTGRYMLLLWLSLLCMVPFDLKIVDSQALGDETSGFVDRMIIAIIPYLGSASKEREAAAYLLAKLVTR
ncbi:hypothetical protein THASP1DRAFT_24285, partial [Thamnocephalis sphaerospora]